LHFLGGAPIPEAVAIEHFMLPVVDNQEKCDGGKISREALRRYGFAGGNVNFTHGRPCG